MSFNNFCLCSFCCFTGFYLLHSFYVAVISLFLGFFVNRLTYTCIRLHIARLNECSAILKEQCMQVTVCKNEFTC